MRSLAGGSRVPVSGPLDDMGEAAADRSLAQPGGAEVLPFGIAKGEATLLDLPMSRRDIAESLGLTIETVSRKLTHLREAGLIRTQGRSSIQLNDLGRLRLHAGYREDAHD